MLDQWGGVVFVIMVVLTLVYINLPREDDDGDDKDDRPWV